VRAFLDTNVLVRHLTGDPPAMARRATEFLAASDELLLTDVIVAEIAHVLRSVYRTPHDVAADRLRALISFASVVTVDEAVLLRAIDVYEAHNIGFPDAYLVASAERFGVGRVASFDRSIDKVGTVERVEPR
jgi:predicted nucleic acid-binding protein